MQVVLPGPLAHWRDGGTRIAGEVVAAPVVGVRVRPRAAAPQAALHHRRPVGVREREAGHRAERHLLDDERLQLKWEVEDAEGRRRRRAARRGAAASSGRGGAFERAAAISPSARVPNVGHRHEDGSNFFARSGRRQDPLGKCEGLFLGRSKFRALFRGAGQRWRTRGGTGPGGLAGARGRAGAGGVSQFVLSIDRSIRLIDRSMFVPLS